MSIKCVPSVHQYAHLKILIVAWSGYSANRMISSTKHLCSKLLSRKQDMNAFSYPSSTVSSIQLKWYVKIVLYLSLLTKSNTLFKYWGWVKYRYREVPKKNFVKDVTLCYLNACPADVIQWFINHSWWFMSAYQKGLNSNAAAWAIRKQKQHCQVSNWAMMLIDAVLNPN